MIDLHSHILPGVDDGAPDIEAALDIAQMAVDDGIQVMACTPHFMPGLYDNTAADIVARIQHLQDVLDQNGLNLHLVSGCDAHIRPDFLNCLRNQDILTLNSTRYVLFEPSHITAPQRMDEFLHNITASGFVPILTHPERLRWIEQKYDLVPQLASQGVVMQITCGSLTGRFGKRAQYLAQRMLAEGLVHILATDAHNVTTRPPLMSEAMQIAESEVGLDEARMLVLTRPAMILDNEPVSRLSLPAPDVVPPQRPSLLNRLFGRRS